MKSIATKKKNLRYSGLENILGAEEYYNIEQKVLV